MFIILHSLWFITFSGVKGGKSVLLLLPEYSFRVFIYINTFSFFK